MTSFLQRVRISRSAQPIVAAASLLVVFLTNDVRASAPAFLVRDINPAAPALDGSYWCYKEPGPFFEFGGLTYFVDCDYWHGAELWRTDGTPSGTTLVKDLTADSTFTNNGSGERGFAELDGKLYFVPGFWNQAPYGSLWRTDGTAGGTEIVAPNVEEIRALTAVGGKLLFHGKDYTAGLEGLWVSDGTTAGTSFFLAMDVYPWYESSGTFVRVGGKALFRGYDGTSSGLFGSDGTVAGTAFLNCPEPAFARGLHAFVGSTLFFTGGDTTHGHELWTTDGTVAGTTLVKDINPGVADSLSYHAGISFFAVLGGNVLFMADDGLHGRELWISDGTAAGTTMVADIEPGPNGSSPQGLTTLADTVLFRANTSINSTALWRSDGTVAGTALVKEIDLEGASLFGYAFEDFPTAGGLVYFRAWDPGTGYELWKSDGTGGGTTIVKDLEPGPGDAYPEFFAAVADKLWLYPVVNSTPGRRWITDGTETGTVLFDDFAPTTEGSYPLGLADVGGTLFFSADDGTNGRELWRSDGTFASTVLVRDIWPGGHGFPSGIAAVGGAAFFSADDGTNGRELWKSDGTSAGTVLVKDILPGASAGMLGYPTIVDMGGVAYFAADDGVHGIELWRSDGTAAGTSLVADIAPGSVSGVASYLELKVVGGELFFAADDGTTGGELWKTDGTPGGTTLVRDINPGPGSSHPGSFASVAGTLIFAADDGSHGQEPWLTDGTPGGTAILADMAPGSGSSAPYGFVETVDAVFFAADDDPRISKLWRTDGTIIGTILIKDFAPGEPIGFPILSQLTAVGRQVHFFIHPSWTTSWEYWVSDGTLAGTQQLLGGGLDSYVTNMSAVAGHAMFSSLGASGLEPWRSDGTAARTELLADVWTGAVSSSPQSQFVESGSNVFFPAYDDATGVELRAIPLSAVTWPCGFAPLVGCAEPVVAAGKGSLQLKDHLVNDKLDFLKWDFRDGPLASSGEFGDLIGGTDSIAVCIFDHAGGAPKKIAEIVVLGGGTCGTRPCWKTTPTGKLVFGDKIAAQGGIKKVELKPAAVGKTQFSVKASGVNLEPPAPPFLADPKVTAQLRSSTGACWEANFSNALRNQPGRFQAKVD